MNEQLFLLQTDDRPWRLDDRTRDVGRRGLAEARAALGQATAGAGAKAPGRRGPDRSAGRRGPAGLTRRTAA
jgi:hypothetical protein